MHFVRFSTGKHTIYYHITSERTEENVKYELFIFTECVCFLTVNLENCIQRFSLCVFLPINPLNHLTLVLLDKYKHKAPILCVKQSQRYTRNNYKVKKKLKIKTATFYLKLNSKWPSLNQACVSVYTTIFLTVFSPFADTSHSSIYTIKFGSILCGK